MLRLLSAFRGYTLMVWAMVAYLTRGSNAGVRAVELALASGGVLVAVTLLVPGVPLALTLLGVLLLLAGLTTAALRAGGGAPRVGRRLLLPLLVVAIALGLLVWRDIASNGLSDATVWTLVIKFLVALLITLLGLWVARVASRRPVAGTGRRAGR